jgi:hypothetical protein
VAAWAACFIPGNGAYSAMLKRAFEVTRPRFVIKARFDVLGLAIGLLGSTIGFLVAFPCFVGDIGDSGVQEGYI